MLEQSSPIVSTAAFDGHSDFQPNVEHWISGHPQPYWTPHGQSDNHVNYDISQQSQQAYGIHDGRQRH